MKFSRKSAIAVVAVLLFFVVVALTVIQMRPTAITQSASDIPESTANVEKPLAQDATSPDSHGPAISLTPESGPEVAEASPTLPAQEPEQAIFASACALLLGQATLVNARNILDKAYASGWRQQPEGIICTDGVFQGTVAKGDTLSKVLENVTDSGSQHYVSAASKVFSMRAFREGQPYIIVTNPETGRVARFEYEINDRNRLVVEGEENPRARLEEIEYATTLDTAAGVIDDNLFQAVADIGETPQLALRLVDLFGSEINFTKNLQQGDSFSALVEKRYRNGEYRGYGRILAATFTNNGKKYEAYLFNDGSGKPQYFNPRGENLHKTLLQSPLAVTRITSRFSHNRKHPILGHTRPHLGVDYGAPTGTPVKAVGDGTVTRRGWAGGYGNQIVITHSSGLESWYAHLSGFARGLKQGQKVRQGQVIGYVGSTGLSTGPHLDFRLKQNGKFINPVKAINPRGAPVANGDMAAFKRTMERARACLAGDLPGSDYKVDSIVPLAVSSSKAKSVESVPTRKAVKNTRKKQDKGRRSTRTKKRS